MLPTAPSRGTAGVRTPFLIASHFLGPFILIACLLLSVVGVGSLVVGAARLGSAGLRRCWLGVLGAILVWGITIAFVGLIEENWKPVNPLPWILSVLGVVGVWLVVRSARAAAGPTARG